MKKQTDVLVVDARNFPGVRTGILAGFTLDGQPLVETGDESAGMATIARSCVQLGRDDVGGSVVLTFENGLTDRPIILGVIRPAGDVGSQERAVDDRMVVIHAEQSIVLRCGHSSIALERDGRVVIRGKQIVSHASGANRIRGGSVELN